MMDRDLVDEYAQAFDEDGGEAAAAHEPEVEMAPEPVGADVAPPPQADTPPQDTAKPDSALWSEYPVAPAAPANAQPVAKPKPYTFRDYQRDSERSAAHFGLLGNKEAEAMRNERIARDFHDRLTQRRMTGDLQGFLKDVSDFPDGHEVVMAKDPNGNGFHLFYTKNGERPQRDAKTGQIANGREIGRFDSVDEVFAHFAQVSPKELQQWTNDRLNRDQKADLAQQMMAARIQAAGLRRAGGAAKGKADNGSGPAGALVRDLAKVHNKDMPMDSVNRIALDADTIQALNKDANGNPLPSELAADLAFGISKNPEGIRPDMRGVDESGMPVIALTYRRNPNSAAFLMNPGTTLKAAAGYMPALDEKDGAIRLKRLGASYVGMLQGKNPALLASLREKAKTYVGKPNDEVPDWAALLLAADGSGKPGGDSASPVWAAVSAPFRTDPERVAAIRKGTAPGRGNSLSAKGNGASNSLAQWWDEADAKLNQSQR